MSGLILNWEPGMEGKFTAEIFAELHVTSPADYTCKCSHEYADHEFPGGRCDRVACGCAEFRAVSA